MLDLVTKRQAAWSATADSLKGSLDTVRWITFGLSIAGALLATLAAQATGDLRLWLAMSGAAALGAVTFLTSRLMGGTHVSVWVRARGASEALKREGYKFAAQAAPYEDPQTRTKVLTDEYKKIEDGVIDLVGQQVEAKKASSMPKDAIKPDEYIAMRITKQCNGFFVPKAEHYRKLAKRLGWIEFLLALAATLITTALAAAGKPPSGFDFVGLAAVFTTIGGAIAAHVQASRYEFIVTSYRATARRLENEAATALSFTAPSKDWSDFVERCETILAEENGAWIAKWTK